MLSIPNFHKKGFCPEDEFPFLQVATITGIQLVLGEAYTVEWDNIRDQEKIDCYPDEHGASEENCIARGCIWEVTMPKMFPEPENPCNPISLSSIALYHGLLKSTGRRDSRGALFRLRGRVGKRGMCLLCCF